MREAIAFFILAAVIVFLAVYWAREHQAIYAMPLINAAAPSCPRLANPCDRVNCNRPNTRIIA